MKDDPTTDLVGDRSFFDALASVAHSTGTTGHWTAAYDRMTRGFSVAMSAAQRAAGGQIPNGIRWGPSSAPRRAPVT